MAVFKKQSYFIRTTWQQMQGEKSYLNSYQIMWLEKKWPLNPNNIACKLLLNGYWPFVNDILMNPFLFQFNNDMYTVVQENAVLAISCLFISKG